MLRPGEEEHYLLVDEGSSYRSNLDYTGETEGHPKKCPCAPGVSFFALLFLCGLMAALLYWTNNKTTLVFFVLTVWMVSLCFHEFGHAITAYYGGDYSVQDKGYLTLDILQYTDMIGTILIPLLILLLGGIGLPGGAVFVNLGRIDSKLWKSVVSLAGPFATFLFALLICSIFVFYEDVFGMTRDMQSHDFFWNGLAMCAFVQFTALLLNLFPCPPFDGFGCIHPWLPEFAQDWLSSNFNYTLLSFAGLTLVFVLFWRVPAVMHLLFGFTTFFGVPDGLAQDGLTSFRLI